MLCKFLISLMRTKLNIVLVLSYKFHVLCNNFVENILHLS